MLKTTLIKLREYFRPKTERELIHNWLSESTDLVDLERRQRDLTHNRAPFQMQHNMRAKGHYN
jgi:hypothetical protein